MKLSVKFLFIMLIFIIISGCENDVKNEFANLYTQIAKIKCKKEFECCETSTKPRHYQTVNECVKYMEILSYDSVEYISFSNYKWNKENADKCLEYWNNYSRYSSACEDNIYIEKQLSENEQARIDDLEASCNELLVPASQLEDKCYLNTDKGDGCAEGLTCFRGTYTCKKTPVAGESCIEIDSCYSIDPDKEIYCDKEYQKDSEGNFVIDENGKHILTSAICKYAPVVGENCLDKECDRNLENVFCEIIYKKDSEGNFIYDEDTNEKVVKSSLCKELPKKDEDCELSGECFDQTESQLYCTREENDDEEKVYFCRTYPVAGEPCNENYLCARGLTCKYETDGETPVRMCREKSAENEACEDTIECKDELFCKMGEDSESGICAKRYEGGEACLENYHCFSGRCLSSYGEVSLCMGETLADSICVPFDYNDDY